MQPPQNDLITVASFNSDHEAQVAKGILQSSGIDAFVFKDDCGGMMPQLQSITGVHLKVSAHDKEKARVILEQAQSPSVD